MNQRKGLILAGGLGTRLHPATLAPPLAKSGYGQTSSACRAKAGSQGSIVWNNPEVAVL